MNFYLTSIIRCKNLHDTNKHHSQNVKIVLFPTVYQQSKEHQKIIKIVMKNIQTEALTKPLEDVPRKNQKGHVPGNKVSLGI